MQDVWLQLNTAFKAGPYSIHMGWDIERAAVVEQGQE